MNLIKIISITAIVLLVVNIVLVSFRIITNAVFWIFLICISIFSLSLIKLLRKVYKDKSNKK